MFVDITLPQGGVEADIRAYDEKGNPVQVSRLVVEPYFFRPTEIVSLLYASLHEGKMPDTKEDLPDRKNAKQRSKITVSGTSGRLNWRDCTKNVVPQHEAPPDEDKKKKVKTDGPNST